ncbi:MAG: RNA 2',3'-cyclic phosphodiesterase [Solirubrobacteraceae bacterium]
MSRGARLFAAVDPPAETRGELAAWARRSVGSSGARPIAADALHITLCFLGSQPVERLEEIAAVVTASAAPVGRLGLGAPVWLPRRRPRALAVEVHDETGTLTDLAGDLGRALGEAIGWVPESRRFRPHLTVARMRARPVTPGRLEPTPALAFEPESLSLYRSRLDPDGAVYEAVARVALFWPGSGPG